MGEMLERAFTEQRLLDAWGDVRAAALADGEAGAEVERFEAASARYVSEIAGALRDGTFQPHPVVRVEVIKHGGGVRKLAVPTATA
jgi:retron-type reverse transcriptase